LFRRDARPAVLYLYAGHVLIAIGLHPEPQANLAAIGSEFQGITQQVVQYLFDFVCIKYNGGSLFRKVGMQMDALLLRHALKCGSGECGHTGEVILLKPLRHCPTFEF
jgi:hypothetical protein